MSVAESPVRRQSGERLWTTPRPITATSTALVEITIPVYNEERVLARSIARLVEYLDARFVFPYRVVIVDNASTDATWPIASALAGAYESVSAIHLDRKGRGLALRTAWTASDADVLCYMDVDLSTGLDALLPLVAPLVSGHSDVAIGSRLARGARVIRGAKRELISRSYNAILHTALRSRFSDAQCGFKAIRSDVAAALLPAVADDGWFFDTELLVLAERSGLRIHEVPVDWADDPDSRVAIARTAVDDLKGVARMIRTGLSGADAPAADVPLPVRRFERQVGTFAAIGVASTVAYLMLYSILRLVLDPLGANAAALLVTAVGNTAANRRFTFRRTGRHQRVRHHVAGLGVFGVGLAITSCALALLAVLVPQPSRLEELACLIAANGLATLARFVILRVWVFPTPPIPPRSVPDVLHHRRRPGRC